MFSRLVPRVVMAAGAFIGMGFWSAPALAQDIVQTFRDPAFGGNPFNGDYLLAIANLSRPKEPTDPVTTPTEEELLASQIKSQLTSSLSLTVISAIQNAKVGQSGTFTFGDQQITYSKSVSGTNVIFKNTKTGETSEIFVPAPGSTGTPAASARASTVSAEQALAAGGSSVALSLPPL
jgi:curli production assembly/transport component CsgF